MITRQQIHDATQQAASHAAIFQIRASEFDATPEDRPIARAIAAAALRRERAALEWASERLATIRRYAAYEGIAGETRPQAPQPFSPAIVLDFEQAPAALEEQAAPVEIEQAAPVDVDVRSVQCPKCGAGAGERCSKQGRPQTRNHDSRTRAAIVQAPAAVDAAPVEIEQAPPVSRRLPGGRVTSGSGLLMIAREDAKHTPPALRTPVQDALIQIKPAYAALLTERYNLRHAENAGEDLETINALRSMARAAEERYNELSAIAQPAIVSAVN